MTERTVLNLVRQVHPYRIASLAWVSLFDNIGALAIAASIVIAALVVSYIVYKLVLYFGLPKASLPKFRLVRGANGAKKVETHDANTGRVKWANISGATEAQQKLDAEARVKPLFYSIRSSVVHFMAMAMRFTIIFFGFYIAAGTAGVSNFGLTFVVSFSGIIITYTFGTVLANISGAFTVALTAEYTEGMIIQVGATKGRILSMSSVAITLSCKDKTGTPYIARIPSKCFNDSQILRFPTEEQGMESFDVFDDKDGFKAETIEQPYVPASNKITLIKSE